MTTLKVFMMNKITKSSWFVYFDISDKTFRFGNDVVQNKKKTNETSKRRNCLESQ